MTASPQRSAAFDGSVIPARRPDVTCVELDGEAVLYDELTGRMHTLNPVAYLLWQCFDEPVAVDELVAELADAFGQDAARVEADLRAMVATSLSQGLLVVPDEDATADEPRPTARQRRRRPRLEPAVDCPSCVRRLDGLGWAATRAVDVGAQLVGVRAATSEIDDLVQHLLRAHLVDDDDIAPAFSVDVRPGADDRLRRLHVLYRATSPVARSRSAGRVVRALLGHLGSLADAETPGPPRLAAVAFVLDRQVVLAPASMRVFLDRVEPRLRAQGVRLADVPVVELDNAPGTIVLPEPSLELAADAALVLGELDASSAGREPSPPDAGSYEVSGWLAPYPDREPSATRSDPVRAVRTYLADVELRVATDPAVVLERLHTIGERPTRAVERTAAAIAAAVLELHGRPVAGAAD